MREHQHMQHHQAEGIRQLSESAVRTASISTFAASELISQSTHAAMHVAICSFTAGVILSLMIASWPNSSESSIWLLSLKNIISLFEQFPSQNYRLATQSLKLLEALKTRVDPGITGESGDDIGYNLSEHTFGSTENAAVAGDYNNITSAASNILEFNFGDLGFSSNTGGPLDDVGQLWLWDDLSNENWMSNFE
ncbi:hypothetical protein PV08_02762 [Exophiala spinifera]|uniref:Uncharacterized protein n=1 Tax=Exophiala spinifera TaxID=91928 RepID=A0A0D2C4G2_9EURO|nr:uncharacterized protein PV08_02762 [Exophiala spinifera]KIW18474.1 hypothetical protein PV08_02762 [Exophiala spinifera]